MSQCPSTSGAFSMEQNTQDPDQVNTDATSLNWDLVAKVMEMVPRHTWPAVLDATVANIVDELPAETMFRMCEMYLTDYYLQNPSEIIPDLMRIKGEEAALYILDSLQLDKIPGPKQMREQEEEQSTDNAPSSVDPA